jgi:hypothetical protein
MSEVMLHGVLNMPAEMWHKDSPIDDIQRQSRYVEASKLIYNQADRIAELEIEIQTDNANLAAGFDLLQEAGVRIAYLEDKLESAGIF